MKKLLIIILIFASLIGCQKSEPVLAPTPFTKKQGLRMTTGGSALSYGFYVSGYTITNNNHNVTINAYVSNNGPTGQSPVFTIYGQLQGMQVISCDGTYKRLGLYNSNGGYPDQGVPSVRWNAFLLPGETKTISINATFSSTEAWENIDMNSPEDIWPQNSPKQPNDQDWVYYIL